MSKSVLVAMLGITFAGGAFAGDNYWHSRSEEPRFFNSHSDAAAVAAPEIDPASALSGLTLLIGGIAVIRGRKK
jgi:hypothetical protein